MIIFIGSILQPAPSVGHKYLEARVGFHAMLVHIQASKFRIPRDTETRDYIDHLERDPHGRRDETQANNCSQCLDAENRQPAANEQPVAWCTKALQAPESNCERAPYSTQPMNRNGPDRVVDPQPVEK